MKIRERQIENEVVATLRTEALEQFAIQKNWGIFAKLFRSAQVELGKERFINQYLAENDRIHENYESGLKELRKILRINKNNSMANYHAASQKVIKYFVILS